VDKFTEFYKNNREQLPVERAGAKEMSRHLAACLAAGMRLGRGLAPTVVTLADPVRLVGQAGQATENKNPGHSLISGPGKTSSLFRRKNVGD